MPKNKKPADSSSSDSGPDDRGPVKKPKNDAKKGDEGGEDSWNLGRNRFLKLTEFKGKWYINIREFYQGPKGDLLPGKKGIMLNMDEWQKFKGALPELEDAIKRNI